MNNLKKVILRQYSDPIKLENSRLGLIESVHVTCIRQENYYTSKNINVKGCPEFSITRLERVLVTGFVSIFQTYLTDISLASHFGP